MQYNKTLHAIWDTALRTLVIKDATVLPLFGYKTRRWTAGASSSAVLPFAWVLLALAGQHPGYSSKPRLCITLFAIYYTIARANLSTGKAAMQKSDFYFDLPEALIAQRPATPRDAARLMCVDRATGARRHRQFCELPALLKPGDILVVNNSKVLPARLIGHKPGAAGVCELLLLRQVEKDVWECLAKPGRRIRPGDTLVFGDETLQAGVLETLPNGGKLARFGYDTATFQEKLDAFGKMPLPPYIHTQLTDNSDYQTVYAKLPGSAAAPTAGLHFTPGLLESLQTAGIGFAEVTLHVGLGTFRPVKAQQLEDHEMHAEWYSISQQAADAINAARRQGGRVVAVGTTSCRTLEAVARQQGGICPASGETDIFLYPGSRFLAIDGLITNFHLPESTLIMLVSAFCGHRQTMEAYREAVEMEYRFFSFGDAMLII